MSNEGNRMIEMKVPERQPGAYLFNGKLAFKLLTGEFVVYDVKGTEAAEIVRLFQEGKPYRY